MITTDDRLLGGLYGLLIGDAAGVPYEFKKPEQLPLYAHIDMIPPESFKRSHSASPPGVWSDDGSQALCLLEYYTEQRPGDRWDQKWTQKLLQWKTEARNWSTGQPLGMGKQTREALEAIESGAEPLTAAECHVTKNGNGSLMRALPTALWFYNSKDSREFAHECMGISHITHPHPYSKYSCILYNMIAQQLIRGMPLEAAISHSKSEIQFLGLGLLRPMLDYVLDEKQHPPKGDFFVINTLWSAIAAIRTTDNFRDAIITSISYGNDTDTTACVAGGLAGILYGFSELPPNWLLLLRDKNIVEPLAQKLLDHNARTH